jgi:heme exporter protein A
MLYDDLTAGQNLRLYARLYDVVNPTRRAAEMLDLVGLLKLRDEPVRTLSRGMQQRLTLGRALLHKPDILLLDEPYSSLDRGVAQVIDRLLQTAVEGGRMVLLATHDLKRGVVGAEHVIILHRGRKVYDGRPTGEMASGELSVLYDRLTSQEVA